MKNRSEPYVDQPTTTIFDNNNKNNNKHLEVQVKYLEGNDTFQLGDMLKSDGNGYSVVGLQMTLTNLHSKYMWVYYLPTSMFTVTSWVSFLLPPTSYPSRTSLLVTVFLCQIGLFNAVIRDTPNQDGGTKNLFHLWGIFSFEMR